MAQYVYACPRHGDNEVIRWPISDFGNVPVPFCTSCDKPKERVPQLPTFIEGETVGRDSGWYDRDYGKRATEDCTAPGKMEYLKKEGVIKDPFDYPAKQVD